MSNPTDTNQASELYELCKEVYERLGWQIDYATWIVGDENGDLFILTKEVEEQGYYDYYAPLYTSDYLLGRLHSVVILDERYIGIVATHDEFAAQLILCDEEGIEKEIRNYHGKTPLIALLKLVIALSEAGELNNDQSS